MCVWPVTAFVVSSKKIEKSFARLVRYNEEHCIENAHIKYILNNLENIIFIECVIAVPLPLPGYVLGKER